MLFISPRNQASTPNPDRLSLYADIQIIVGGQYTLYSMYPASKGLSPVVTGSVYMRIFRLFLGTEYSMYPASKGLSSLLTGSVFYADIQIIVGDRTMYPASKV